MARVWIVLGLICLFANFQCKETVESLSVKLVPGTPISKDVKNYNGEFHIYCYDGEERLLSNIWRTLQIRISSPQASDYEVFQGINASHVYDLYLASSVSYLNLLPWVPETIRLPAFNHSCLGIKAYGSYHVRLDVIRVDYWKLLALACGIFLFFTASSLSRNAFFYYSSGILVGVLGSLLLLVFILGRFIPKKSVAASLMLAGWGLVLYFLQMVWNHMFSIIKEHKNILIGYITVAGIISFGVCYRYGPVTDVRTINLITWTMQGVALTLIFFSTEWQEVALAFVIVTFLIHVFPAKWSAKVRTYWKKRFFRPKVNLLTEDQYHHEGVICTKKALDELRTYCASPDCNSWKLVGKLNKPLRFASFIEGESHLTDNEILAYETEDDSYGKDGANDFSEDSESEIDGEHEVNHNANHKSDKNGPSTSSYQAKVTYASNHYNQ